jgi:hypothetical protein
MNHNLANGMNMWKGNGDTATLLFSIKWLEILSQERGGQVITIVMVLSTSPDLLRSSITITHLMEE